MMQPQQQQQVCQVPQHKLTAVLQRCQQHVRSAKCQVMQQQLHSWPSAAATSPTQVQRSALSASRVA
jgi:hypothetical protein